MMRSVGPLRVIALSLSLLAVACGTSAAAPALEEIEPASVTHVDELGIVDDPALTLIAQGGSPVAFDIAALDKLRQVRVTVYEPFEEKNIAFSGVAMSELLAFTGADERGSAHFLALDDYRADIPLSDIASSSALLATRQDGKAIPVDQGGPVRMVFPEGSETSRNTDLWVWSIKEITVH